MFGEPKTGDRLWELVQTDRDRVRELYGVDAIGICTDDGPDGKKMRRLAKEALPWWIVVLCWAHQNQLIVGDLIKRVPWLKIVIGQALDVIKWFLNHGTALAFLHEQQLRTPGLTRALTLLLPVVSRWGAHYFSVSRLLKLKGPIRTVAMNHEAQLLALTSRGDDEEEGMSRAADIVNTINSQEFWNRLAM